MRSSVLWLVSSVCGGWTYFLPGFFLPATVRLGPLRVRALVRVRCPRTGRPRAVPDALVAADLDLAPDVGGDLAAQVTLDLVVGLDVVAQLHDLIVGQVLGALVGIDAGGRQRLRRAGPAHPEDVGERDLHPLLAGEVDADRRAM